MEGGGKEGREGGREGGRQKRKGVKEEGRDGGWEGVRKRERSDIVRKKINDDLRHHNDVNNDLVNFNLQAIVFSEYKMCENDERCHNISIYTSRRM